MKRKLNKDILIIILILISIYYFFNVYTTKAISEKKLCLPEDQIAKQIDKNIIGAVNDLAVDEAAYLRKSVELPCNFKDVLTKVSKYAPDIDVSKTVIKTSPKPDGSITLNILLKDKNGIPITTKYERILSKDKDGNLIMKNSFLEIQEDFKRRGIATNIYKFEDEFYKSIGVKQVEIVAADDGRYMWSKKEFNFKFKFPEATDFHFESWLESDAGKKWLKTTSPLPEKDRFNKPYLYPKEFLLDKDVKVILYEKQY